MNSLKDIMSPQARKYFYRVAIAVLVLLGALGLITEEAYLPVAGLIAAVFAIGVADGNVPTPREQDAIEQVRDVDTD